MTGAKKTDRTIILLWCLIVLGFIDLAIMFIMTGHIKMQGFKEFPFFSVSCKKSIDNYSDTAVIKLPGIAYLKCNDNNSYERVDTGLQFKEGLKVEIWAGYNNEKKLRFKGFVRRINFTLPLELECEGYSFQLRKKKGITKSWPAGTQLKTVLEYAIAGTDIKLYDKNPSIKIEAPVQFRSVSGTEILDWVKEKLLQTVRFNNEVLYVGLRETENMRKVKFQLGWNVIRDNNLKFSQPRQYAEVNIHLAARNKNGTFASAKSAKKGDTKYRRLDVSLDEATIKRTEEQERKKLANIGYEGSITAFAEPMIEPGEAASIYDKRYPKRTEVAFCDSVDFEFSPAGGRQTIKIGNTIGY